MVNSKIKDPQEIVALYILPSIRSYLAHELKRRGFDQKHIAKVLCVTEPAVSQYVNAKRATETKMTEKMNAEIALAASRLCSGSTILQEAHHLVNVALVERITCSKCHAVLGVPTNCRVCFEDRPDMVLFHEADYIKSR